MINEEWKDIIGYSGIYQISNSGMVRVLERKVNSNFKNADIITRKEKIIRPGIDKFGYKRVALQLFGRPRKSFSVHRLVALHFIPNPDSKPFINHIDSNPSNNNVDNLEWCTQSENIQHAYNIGRKFGPKTNVGKIGVLANTSKKVNQFSLDGILLKTWDCILDAQRAHGYNGPNISKCCLNKIQTAYGYKWQHA